MSAAGERASATDRGDQARTGESGAPQAAPDSPPSARYVAIITDGNGRWARARGVPVNEGHSAGADTVKARLRDAAELGVKELTVYSFSTENWTRPADGGERADGDVLAADRRGDPRAARGGRAHALHRPP